MDAPKLDREGVLVYLRHMLEAIENPTTVFVEGTGVVDRGEICFDDERGRSSSLNGEYAFAISLRYTVQPRGAPHFVLASKAGVTPSEVIPPKLFKIVVG